MSEIIKGKLVSSKGVSVSRAAKLISRFAAVENGSSPTVSLYLQQAAESFNHLVQFHLDTTDQTNPTISTNIKALKSSEDQNNNKKRKNHKSDGDEVDFKNKKNKKKKKKTVIDS